MFSRYWWVMLIGFVVGPVGGLLITAVVTYMMPTQYESSATLEIKFSSSDLSAPPARSQIANEVHIITTRAILEKAVDSLNLTSVWAVTKESAVHTLKSRLRGEMIRGTDLITISAQSMNREEARDLAAAVAAAYSEYRSRPFSEPQNQSINGVRKAVRVQEDKVEEMRRILQQYNPPSRGYSIKGSKNLTPAEIKFEADLELLEDQVEAFQNYKGEELLVFAKGLDYPDNIVRILHPEYLKLEREIGDIKARGVVEGDSLLASKAKSLEQMKMDLNEGVDNLRNRLQAQLELAKTPLGGNVLRDSETSEEQSEDTIETQDFIDAKREFEAELALLEETKVRLMTNEVMNNIPSNTVVIHEEPVINPIPVSPKVTLNLVLGTAGGLVLSPFLTLPIMRLLGRRRQSV